MNDRRIVKKKGSNAGTADGRRVGSMNQEAACHVLLLHVVK